MADASVRCPIVVRQPNPVDASSIARRERVFRRDQNNEDPSLCFAHSMSRENDSADILEATHVSLCGSREAH